MQHSSHSLSQSASEKLERMDDWLLSAQLPEDRTGPRASQRPQDQDSVVADAPYAGDWVHSLLNKTLIQFLNCSGLRSTTTKILLLKSTGTFHCASLELGRHPSFSQPPEIVSSLEKRGVKEKAPPSQGQDALRGRGGAEEQGDSYPGFPVIPPTP